MIRQIDRWIVVASLALLACFNSPRQSGADASPSTQPANTIQTGDVDFTFTERSPLSAPKELARRLNLKPTDVSQDYDLSKQPFKAYIPTNYDPATPNGLFVFLGYKDTHSTPVQWQPVLEKDHLIFISPVSHSGAQYPPTIPLWQMLGLAFDAVHNCKKQFNIDDRRIYMMSWAKDSMKISFSAADIFTGFIVTADPEYCLRINLPGGRYYSPSFAPPPGGLMSWVTGRAFFLIEDKSSNDPEMPLIIAAMKHNDFDHVMSTGLSLGDDLHFPNPKVEWFEQQALPFLDKSSATAKTKAEPPATKPAEAAPAESAAQHLLAVAQLYISNGQPDMARAKLQKIIDTYPTDPAVDKARQLLQQMGP